MSLKHAKLSENISQRITVLKRPLESSLHSDKSIQRD